jgi:hypothetical protein
MASVVLLMTMSLAGSPFCRNNHPVPADGLRGVNLRLRRRVVIPDDLFGGGDLGDAVLVGEQNISVRHEYGVADLALAVMRVGPDDLAAAHDEHPLVLRLASVEEIVLREPATGQNGGTGRSGRGGLFGAAGGSGRSWGG